MTAPGSVDEAGVSHLDPEKKLGFEIPTVPHGGTRRDMGSLSLFLVANWFVNGETVLIDGGVSISIEPPSSSLTQEQTLLKHPSSY